MPPTAAHRVRSSCRTPPSPECTKGAKKNRHVPARRERACFFDPMNERLFLFAEPLDEMADLFLAQLVPEGGHPVADAVHDFVGQFLRAQPGTDRGQFRPESPVQL